MAKSCYFISNFTLLYSYFEWLFKLKLYVYKIKPEVDNILIIGEYPYYYIGFEIFGFLNIMLFYFLFMKTTKYQLEK